MRGSEVIDRRIRERGGVSLPIADQHVSQRTALRLGDRQRIAYALAYHARVKRLLKWKLQKSSVIKSRLKKYSKVICVG